MDLGRWEWGVQTGLNPQILPCFVIWERAELFPVTYSAIRSFIP